MAPQNNVPQPVINDYVQRYYQIRARNDTADKLIEELLVYCQGVEETLGDENQRLLKLLNDANLDLEDARRSRRDMQQQLNTVTSRVGQYSVDCDSMRNRNPYIIALVDGDGMIFNEDLVSQGLEGGKQAAKILRNHVLQNCNELVDEIEVIAKVCANMAGLSKAMKRDGSLNNADDLKDFTLGFTQGKASFDFIDVGHGKERADSKIKECMRWHLRNHNCKQILLGISHDAGYAPILDEVVSQDDRSRITILEGFPTVRELTKLGIQIVNFENLFRSDKLIDRLIQPTSSPVPSTWAGVTSTAPASDQSTSPITKNGTPALKAQTIIKATTSSPKLNWSPEPRGLDPQIAVNPVVLDKIKRRTNSNKLCNNHYLRGPCAKGSDCCFEHDYKATEEDLKAIAYLTRLNPCTKGQECELEFCIYGHHCPSVVALNGGKEIVCQAFGCRFAKEDHPPTTVIKHPRKEKWERVDYYQ